MSEEAAACSDPEETMEGEELTVQLGGAYPCRTEGGACLTRRQSEWVDKTCLVVKQDDTENITDQKMSEDDGTTQSPSEEDEPERKKVKVDSSLVVCKDKEVTCMVCKEFSEDHVTKECGHSFCRNCISEDRNNPDVFSCPDCMNAPIEMESSSKLAPSDTSKATTGGPGTLTKPVKIVKAPPLVNCIDHDEKLKLFCKEDGALGCVICRDSLKHQGHRFLPVPEAVEVYREELSTVVAPLEETLKKTNELTNQQNEEIKQLQDMMTDCRQHITAEFGNLYSFLKGRKEKLLEQLQEQSRSQLEEIETNAAKMVANRDSIKEAIAVANVKVDETDTFYFLDGITELIKTCQDQQEKVASFGEAIIDTQLCRADFKGPIQYFAWKQMKSVVPDHFKAPTPTPEPVIIPGAKLIWMVGNLFMNKVQDRAKSSSVGPNLGFDEKTCKVHWLIMPLASNVNYELQKAKRKAQPDIIFIHKDINFNKMGIQLRKRLLNLTNVAEHFPGKVVILSTSLPTHEMWGTDKEERRRAFNFKLKQASLVLKTFQLAKHDELEKKLIERYMAYDLFSYSDDEMDLFLTNVRYALQEAMGQDVNAIIHKLETPPSVDSQNKATVKEPQPASPGKPAEPAAKVTGNDQQKTPLRKVEPAEGVKQPTTLEKKEAPGTSKPNTANSSIHFKAPTPTPEPTPTTVIKNTSSPATQSPGTKVILMVGCLFMNNVQDRAKSSTVGPNLGFDKKTCKVHWFIHPYGSDLSRGLLEAKQKVQPDIIFIHVECSFRKTWPKLERRMNVFRNAAKIFPSKVVILSLSLPTYDIWVKGQESRRTKFNSRLMESGKHRTFQLVEHRELEKKLIERYKAKDLRSYTDDEMNLFLTDVRYALQKAMGQDVNDIIQKLEIPPSVDSQNNAAVTEPQPTSPGKPAEPAAKDHFEEPTPTPEPAPTPVIKNISSPATQSPGAKVILMVGNLLMNKVQDRAKSSSVGPNLGFDEKTCKVHWLITTDASDVNFQLHKAKREVQPDIIFIHINLNFNKTWRSFKDRTAKVIHAADFFPGKVVILSLSLPTHDIWGKGQYNWQIMFNTWLMQRAEHKNFQLAKHNELEKKLLMRFKAKDLRSYTDDEMDLFLTDVRYALQKAMGQKLEMPPSVDSQKNAAVKEPQPAAARKPAVKAKDIWIIGNAYINEASLVTDKKSYKNLGFDKEQWQVRWMMHIGQWSRVVHEMNELSRDLGTPSIVFLHVSNRHFGNVTYEMLVEIVTSVLRQLASLYPKTQFIFSTILPRPEWLSSAVEDTRKRFNSDISAFAKECGFELATNSKLEQILLKKFRAGRQKSLLNYQENSVFIESIKYHIEQAMLKLDKPAIENQEPLCTGENLVVSTPGTAESTEDKKATEQKTLGLKYIWIIGNSYICKAAQKAMISSVGVNLGYKKWIVHWMGRVGMNWSSLLSEMDNALSTLVMPSIVFIHLGDFDVGSIPYEAFTKTIEDDLSQITTKFNKTEFIFSTLLPNAQSLTNSNEQSRKDFNNALIRYAEELGFHVSTHIDIEESVIKRFKAGGSNGMSDYQYDMFVTNIKSALGVVVRRLEGQQHA